MTDPSPKKLRIGWFSFTCCEDSTIMLTELLNEHFFAWRMHLDFVNAKVFRKSGPLEQLDVAFVEGAISSEKQTEKLKKIRESATKLVAIGSCAVSGFPSAQRNLFDETTKAEIQPILKRFAYLPKVLRVNEIVPVDAFVSGCPMNTDQFLVLMDKLFEEFGIRKNKE